MSKLTTDKNDPDLDKTRSDGQQEAYLILSEEERAKGFVRPVRTKYVHRGILISGKITLLNVEEVEKFKQYNYYAYMEYSNPIGSVIGRYLSKKQYESINKVFKGFYGGCGIETKMSQELAETYARQPDFYGLTTFCVGCGKHLSVEEFVWSEGNQDKVVGS
jgi:C-terminal processing protease CtpA/Prc